MERILKFRGWDSVDKKMFEPFELRYGLDECANSGHVYTVFPPTTIFLQFTNNYDSKGAEIYHGHILKYTDGRCYDVQCYQGNFCIFMNEEVFYLTDKFCRQFEVVGNVFQNADLVEVPVDMSVFNKKV